MAPMQVGQLVLRFLRIPILAGVPSHEQPQSLEEASRGLKYMSWHKSTWFEGTLTQYGGDCSVGFILTLVLSVPTERVAWLA